MYLDISLFIFFVVMSCIFGATITALIFNLHDCLKKDNQILPLFNVVNPIYRENTTNNTTITETK